jgi:hypothetical protein
LYCVPLSRPGEAALAPLDFLASRPGGDRDKARTFLRANPGFVARRLAYEAAMELRAAAAAAGLDAGVTAEEDLPVPPPAARPVKVELAGTGFTATTAATRDFYPFESVRVICAGAYDAETAPLNLDGAKAGIIAELREKFFGPPAVALSAPPRDTFFRADLVLEGGLRLLLEPEKLDFSPLGADRAPSALANFRLLLGRLAAPCFGALRNAFVPAFLASRPLAPHKAASAAACDTALARLLLLARR